MRAQAELYLNGINAVTGQYMVRPMERREVIAMIRGEKAERAAMSWLKSAWRRLSEPHLGLPIGIDPRDVRSAGWAVVIYESEAPEVKEALIPLIEHRREQVGDETRVKVLEYRPKETRQRWLARHGVAAGSVWPSKVPYYLLFIGSPEKIPFAFRHQLGVEYATGSLHFESVAEYSSYISSLIRYEKCEPPAEERDALFFGVRHSFDPATQLSADRLVRPLALGTGDTPGIAERHGFRTRCLLGNQASKSAMLSALSLQGSGVLPAFIFTASHGLGFPPGHPEQQDAQGALICQDWPGFGCVCPDHYLAAADLPKNANFQGLVTFHFACFGAGTPSHERYLHSLGVSPPPLANTAFIAALPQKLLAHGALGCIGHVERAWGCSVMTPKAGVQLLPFENAIGRILTGEPLGCALTDFSERYAALSVSLSSLLEEISFGVEVPDFELLNAWVERNDAEGYLLIGDPAARLRIG